MSPEQEAECRSATPAIVVKQSLDGYELWAGLKF